MEFVFSPDGNSFQGKWGYGINLDNGYWSGSRLVYELPLITESQTQHSTYVIDFNINKEKMLQSTFSQEVKNSVGVAFIPYMYGDKAADSAEQMLVTAMGEIKAIDYVFTPKSASDVFDTLLKLKRSGKKISAIVLAGHSSEGDPIILFGGGSSISPSDVDLSQLSRDLEGAKKRGDNAQAQRLESKIKMLESVAEVALPGTQVLVLNCNTAKTEKGKEFINNLGNVLVGQYGGTVTAPTNIVKLYPIEYYSQWIKHMISSWFSSNFDDTIVDATWQRFQIAPRSQSRTETLIVPNTESKKVSTSFPTKVGAIYVIEASGVVSDWSDKSDGVDATGTHILYNPEHIYRIELPGTGEPFVFHMLDAQNSAGDNSGSIQVTVTEKR